MYLSVTSIATHARNLDLLNPKLNQKRSIVALWGVDDTSMQNSRTESLLAAAVVLISICAFVVSLFQAQVMQEQTRFIQEQVRIMQQQQSAAVWPRLFVARNSGPGLFEIVVRNEGVGPAQIQHVEVKVNGEPQRNWPETFQALIGLGETGWNKSTLNRRIVRQGDEIRALAVQSPTLADEVNAHAARLAVTVCYCSIYDACWQLNEDFGGGGFALPEPVEACTIDPRTGFLE